MTVLQLLRDNENSNSETYTVDGVELQLVSADSPAVFPSLPDPVRPQAPLRACARLSMVCVCA